MGTTDPEEWADIEGALRSYLRADAGVQAAVGQRVFFGMPRKVTDDTFPCIMITRIGGGQQTGEVPLDMAMIQFDCYGKLADEANGGRLSATTTAVALRKCLSTLRGRTTLVPGVDAFDCRVATVVYSPLPGDDRPRMMVMAIIPNMVSSVS